MTTPAGVIRAAVDLLNETSTDAAPPGQEWPED